MMLSVKRLRFPWTRALNRAAASSHRELHLTHKLFLWQTPPHRSLALGSTRRLAAAARQYEEDLYDEGEGGNEGDPQKTSKKGKLKLKERAPLGSQSSESQRDREADRVSDEREQSNQDGAVTATKVGAGVNLVLAAGKGGIGFLVNSTGLMADGANHLGDLLCDAVVWYTVIESRKVATVDRPWGMGKLEPLGALTVGALLMATGMGIGYSAGTVAWEMLLVQMSGGAEIGAAVAPLLVPDMTQKGPLQVFFISLSLFLSLSLLASSTSLSLLPLSLSTSLRLDPHLLTPPLSLLPPSPSLSLSRPQQAALGISGLSIVGKELLFR